MIPGEWKAIGRVLAIVLGIAALIGVVLFLRSCGAAPAEEKAARAAVEQSEAESFTNAARDATAITGNTMDATAAVDHQTETNHDTIAHGDGNNRTALSSLCLRAAYRDQPRCAALLKPSSGSTR
ncbi:hypothetical protein [Sphingomonas sp. MMS24-J13]|uniref:hypothetical protein n=1 Tax=Sphingomonas sp. MMS24-J13 TaxID=3238686 RepID=UPI0038502409